MRLKGYDVVYVCATDEHGTPIAVMAEKEGVTPKEVVDKYHRSIRDDLQRLGCSFDIFGRTTQPSHYTLTQEFFLRLLQKGYIYEGEYEQLYCSHCKRYLPDRYVEGVCPYCGAERARGDACEACGRYLKPTELKKPYCITCGTTPKVKKTNHWFFKLSAFQTSLQEWIAKNEGLPANVKNYALQWVREGLKDWCLTRDLEWGVPVPVEGAKGKAIYVWFDAPIGYVSSTLEWSKAGGKPEAWKDYWCNKGSKIVHFIGKDIIYHHAIFWPAMLEAHGDYQLPTAVMAGEYLTLEGRKMSKSRGWVVEVEDYLNTFEPDPLRYYLTVVAPLQKDANFSWEEYARKNNDELADIIGNFIHRSLTFTYQYFEGKVPKPDAIGGEDRATLGIIKATHNKVGEALERCDFHAAIRSILELAATGNRYLNEKQPWKTVKTEPTEAATTLYVANQIVKSLAILLTPFLPQTADSVWKYLNLPGDPHKQNWDEAVKELPAGHAMTRPKPLFRKLEAETIETQRERLQATLERAKEAAVVLVSVEDFSKLDLRVGRVVEAEPMPKSKKLLKLTIDAGDKMKRQAVAAIAGEYTPKQLVGKLVVIVANLRPSKILGVESQTMILAAEDAGKFVILQPEKPVRPGSKVR